MSLQHNLEDQKLKHIQMLRRKFNEGWHMKLFLLLWCLMHVSEYEVVPVPYHHTMTVYKEHVW